MAVVVPSSALTGSYADFLDLRTAVIEFVSRPDIADVFPRLLRNAESTLNQMLRMHQQVVSDTLVFSGGVAALPEDYLEMIGVYGANGAEYVQQTLQRARRTGTHYYAINSQDITSSMLEGSLEAEYYAKIPTITSSVTASNWLLQDYPDVYFYAACYEAARYIKDPDLAGAAKQMLNEALGNATADNRRARYSRARVRVQGCTP